MPVRILVANAALLFIRIFVFFMMTLFILCVVGHLLCQHVVLSSSVESKRLTINPVWPRRCLRQLQFYVRRKTSLPHDGLLGKWF